MLPDLSEIKIKRKELNLTQEELSELSKVPQSIIAKIENHKISPSYESAKKIFDVLGKENKKKQTARNVMSKNLISIKENEKAEKAIYLMNRHGISQLPVMKKDIPIGTITEKTLVEKISSGKVRSSDKASDLMQESLPIIESNSEIEAVSAMLKYYSAVLVKEKDKIIGIITRTDVIRKSINRKN
ncbi:CBS domain-containing protein [Candidatus Micrarchaeota archaeon]|nr:CBS domain-containing protein [Candidatus Micrarchaeota archaeon]MBU2475950.1 CBS domain-containing protein [Candidatus Micrarchaeota archaeon]